MPKYFIKFLFLLLIFGPTLVFAQFSLTGTFSDVVDGAIGVIHLTFPVLMVAAFLVFFWSLSKFILAAGNKVEVENAKRYMGWAILALFLLLTWRAVVGLIAMEFFNVDSYIPGF